MRDKLAEWLRRYLPLEIAATLAALGGGLGIAALTANPLAIAYAGTWSENAGYYGMAIWREMRVCAPAGEHAATSLGQRAKTAARRLLWEFGAAEVMDSFVTRPFCLYWGATLSGNLALGLLLGKLAADLLFYTVAIIFYEAGRRLP